jgi:hypothetical protein
VYVIHINTGGYILSNTGINYKPNIEYELKDLPANEYIKDLLESEKYISPSEVIEETKENLYSVDYLIHIVEQKLSSENKSFGGVSFDEYKKAAVKKYYCHNVITYEENEIINNYEKEISSIDGDIKGDFYKRFLSLKSDIEYDIVSLNKLNDIDTKNMERFLDNLAIRYETDDYLDKVYDSETKTSLRNKLTSLNQKVDYHEKEKDFYDSKYKQAISNGDKEKAKLYKKQSKKIDKKLNDVTNNVSYAAAQSYTFHKKAESTGNYLKKAGYLLAATPYDNLGGKICCFLKLIIRSIYDGDENYLEKFHADLKINKNLSIGGKKYSLSEIIKAIDAIRGLLAIAYGKDKVAAFHFVNEITKMILSPVRKIISKAISELQEVEEKLVSDTMEFFDFIAETNPERPNGVLDCLYLESVADIIYDVIDDIFEDLEEKIIDLYKYIYAQTKKYSQDIVVIGKKEVIREIYKMLSEFSKILSTIDGFTFEEGIEEWIESFLIKAGYGTTYNPATGNFEPISLDGCLDSGRFTGDYSPVYPVSPEEIQDVDFDKIPFYRDFYKERQTITYVCETREE